MARTRPAKASRPADFEPLSGALIPPHSIEAERGLLGSVLLDAPRVLDLCIERRIGPDAFYEPAHAAVFEVLLEMHRRGEGIDLNTLTQRLRDQQRLDEVGGHARLVELVESTITPAHAEYYAKLVHEKYLLRRLIDRCRASIEDCYRGDKSVEDILSEAEQAVLEVNEVRAADITAWPSVVQTVFAEMEALMERKAERTGISTGYRQLDRLLLGLQPSDMIILAARPSMGKTSLAMNICEHVATGFNVDTQYGDFVARPVLVFSCEMSKEALTRRMICSRARVEWARVSRGILTDREHARLVQAVDALSKANVLVDDAAGLSVGELRARARRVHRQYPDLALIVVDYLQLLHFPGRERDGRQQETAAISGALKAMAKELRVPVLVLSQLSRSPENRDKNQTPRLSDLRDSGSIEQDADVVLLLQRPCRIKSHDEYADKRLAIVDVAKHRNGATGIVRMNFEEYCMRFEDREERIGDDEAIVPSAGAIDE